MLLKHVSEKDIHKLISLVGQKQFSDELQNIRERYRTRGMVARLMIAMMEAKRRCPTYSMYSPVAHDNLVLIRPHGVAQAGIFLIF